MAIASEHPASPRAGGFSRNLRRWNLAMGALHLAQGLLVLAIASDFSLPVTAAFVRMNQETLAPEPKLETLFDLDARSQERMTK